MLKKILLFSVMCLAAMSIFAQSYIDLDLPSGTLWKNKNETSDFYTYAQAEGTFHDNLPAKWQWDELKEKCQWEWTGNGYTVTGKNGNSIFLPAAGCRTSAGHLKGIGERGFYWVFTPKGLGGALLVVFIYNEVRVVEDELEGGCSVRLVK